MTLRDIEWDYVRRHTLLPGLSALLAAILMAVAMWFHAGQAERFAEFSVNQDAMHEDYDELVYRRRLVDRYHRRYQQFHELGFVGKESRLDWIETLRLATEDLTLPRVSYAIEPQLAVVAPVQSIAAGGDTQIHVSRLQLEMGLVHELDLLRFVDELQKKAPGLIKIDSCNLSWLADGETELKAEANIAATCAIQIFSVITSDVEGRVAQL